jgi:hypothetical protein
MRVNPEVLRVFASAYRCRDDSGCAAACSSWIATGAVDQDAAHRLGGSGEEVAAPAPVGRLPFADQPEVRLVDQGGRLEGLAGLLLDQPGGGQFPQLVVDQGQQLARRLRVALLDRRENAGDVVHE